MQRTWPPFLILLGLAPLIFVSASALGQTMGDPEVVTLDGSPLDDLPAHIRLLTDFGSRPDWSPDGDRLVFIDGAPLGDVLELDVATTQTRKLTGAISTTRFTPARWTSGSCPSTAPKHGIGSRTSTAIGADGTRRIRR